MPRALLSVTDKTGLAEFAKGLVALGWDLVSTGGTAKLLRESGLQVTDVAEVTAFPEMLDGRVKTLHPAVHGGLLADLRLESHRDQLKQASIEPISMAVINLYAFERTVSGNHSLEEAIESIDIGGPAMIRAAAKNHANVAIVVDPEDYSRALQAIENGTLPALRLKLAAKAFRHTAFYDSMVAGYLTEAAGEDTFTETVTFGFRRRQFFRYGENPHQRGAWYEQPLAGEGIAQATQLWGKEVSYNNLLDAHAAWELACDLAPGACVIVKHGNPCGAAVGTSMGESYREARRSDPVSAFGGIAAFHGEVGAEAAEAMTEKGNFLEVVIGTSFSEQALALFQNRSGWGADVRLLVAPKASNVEQLTFRWVRGGAGLLSSDETAFREWTVVSSRTPTEEEMAALRFQWTVVPHVKSNAIVVGGQNAMFGCGAGQQNRVRSVRLALEQAEERAKGAVLASDAFFPFADSIHVASEAGITAIVQPGGSKKDLEVIAAANEMGIAMVFTNTRHFLH